MNRGYRPKVLQVKFDSDRVRKHITNINKSLAQFAYDNGINEKTLQSQLSTKFNPRLYFAFIIAKAMDCTIDDLLIVTYEKEQEENKQE